MGVFHSRHGLLAEWLPIPTKNVHTLGMSLKNAAFFALVGMVLLTVLLTRSLIINVSGVMRGFIPAVALLTSLVQ